MVPISGYQSVPCRVVWISRGSVHDVGGLPPEARLADIGETEWDGAGVSKGADRVTIRRGDVVLASAQSPRLVQAWGKTQFI